MDRFTPQDTNEEMPPIMAVDAAKFDSWQDAESCFADLADKMGCWLGKIYATEVGLFKTYLEAADALTEAGRPASMRDIEGDFFTVSDATLDLFEEGKVQDAVGQMSKGMVEASIFEVPVEDFVSMLSAVLLEMLAFRKRRNGAELN